SNTQGLVLGEVEVLPAERDAAVADTLSTCVDLVRRVVEQAGNAVFPPPHRYESASWGGFRLAEILPLPMTTRQRLLEMDDPTVRLSILHGFLAAGTTNSA